MAFIPARSGSSRIPAKNIRRLAGHPLIAYTIASARASDAYERVIVSTNSEATADVARYYGAETPFIRPDELAGSNSPDIEWVDHALEHVSPDLDAFSILRPTSPFRSVDTIRLAFDAFAARSDADSLRAVERCRQHPAKMWTIRDDWLEPLMGEGPGEVPWHSAQYQTLPEVYAQNGSLEIAWIRTVRELGTISGRRIVPFVMPGNEGFDLNWPEDWFAAEHMLELGEAALPHVELDPYPEG